MIVRDFEDADAIVPAMHVLFACVKRSELCVKFKTVMEGAIAAALNSSIYWARLEEETLSPTSLKILPAITVHVALVDWVQYLMTPGIFKLLCSRIKQVINKHSAACLALLLGLVKKGSLSPAQLETVSSLVTLIPSKKDASFDHASCKRDIMKLVFEMAVRSEAKSTELSAESTKPTLFLSVFAVVPINEHPMEQIAQLCQAFLDKMKTGRPLAFLQPLARAGSLDECL